MTSIIPIRKWSEGYAALLYHAEVARGAVETTLCTGERQRWPRTTGGDVFLVATFLHPHLIDVDVKPDSWRRWQSCLYDVIRWGIANPREEYCENRRFWEEVLRVTVHLAAEAAPLPMQHEWEELFEDLARLPRNGVPKESVPFGPFPGAETYKDLYVGQVLYLQKARGMDRMEPEPGMTGGTKNIPRSTYADVEKLAGFWGAEALMSRPRLGGDEATFARWNNAIADIRETLKGGKPNDVYPKNNKFWRDLNSITTYISVMEEAPSTATRVLESVKHGINELPTTLNTAARAVAGGIAGGVGSVAGGLLGGLFGAFKVPLMVVGGGIAGIYLLSRRSPDRASEKV